MRARAASRLRRLGRHPMMLGGMRVPGICSHFAVTVANASVHAVGDR
jgi:hypothetical protein